MTGINPETTKTFEDIVFDDAVEFLMSPAIEGYKSNDAADPGKRTVFGISEVFHPEAFPHIWECQEAEAREIARGIYREKYFNPLFNKIPWLDCKDIQPLFFYPIISILFDVAVNNGVERAVEMGKVSIQHELFANVFDTIVFLRLSRYTAKSKQVHIRGQYKRVAKWINHIDKFIAESTLFNPDQIRFFRDVIMSYAFTHYLKED